MPLFGQLDVATVAGRLPAMPHLDTEAWELPQADMLQLAWETSRVVDTLLPRAMHPAVPRYVTFWVASYPQSPVGPFRLAQLRIMSRAGAHPRGFVVSAVASTAEAAQALAERWGIPAEHGTVALKRYHDQVSTTVTRGGQVVLDAALLDPETISGSDVQYIHSVTLARVVHDGAAGPHLIQVDPRYTFHKAERGRPAVTRFEAAAWHVPGVALTHPISASVVTCDTDLPQIRFIMDPDVPVVRGTRKIRDSRQ
jgi:hypothetical protein